MKNDNEIPVIEFSNMKKNEEMIEEQRRIENKEENEVNDNKKMNEMKKCGMLKETKNCVMNDDRIRGNNGQNVCLVKRSV